MSETTPQNTSYLVFECLHEPKKNDPGIFAISLDAIEEIIEVDSIEEVPHSPDVIRGIFAFRGRIITVIYPWPMLGYDQKKSGNIEQVVVLRNPGNKRGHIGLSVERIHKIVKKSDMKDDELAPTPMISWKARFENFLIHGIDIEILLKEINSLCSGANLNINREQL